MYVVRISKGDSGPSPNLDIQYQGDKTKTSTHTSTQLNEQGSTENITCSLKTSQEGHPSTTIVPGENKYVSLLSNMKVQSAESQSLTDQSRDVRRVAPAQPEMERIQIGYPEVSVSTHVPITPQDMPANRPIGYQEVSTHVTDTGQKQSVNRPTSTSQSVYRTIPQAVIQGDMYTAPAGKRMVLIQQYPAGMNHEIEDAVANINGIVEGVHHDDISVVVIENDQQEQTEFDEMGITQECQIYESLPLEDILGSKKTISPIKQFATKSVQHTQPKNAGVQKFTVEDLNAIGKSEKEILLDFFESSKLSKKKQKVLQEKDTPCQTNVTQCSVTPCLDKVAPYQDSVTPCLDKVAPYQDNVTPCQDSVTLCLDKVTPYQEKATPNQNNDTLDISAERESITKNDGSEYSYEDGEKYNTEQINMSLKSEEGSVLLSKQENQDLNTRTTKRKNTDKTSPAVSKKIKFNEKEGHVDNEILVGIVESETNGVGITEPVLDRVADRVDFDNDSDTVTNACNGDEGDWDTDYGYWRDICKCVHYADKCVIKIAPILKKIIQNKMCVVEVEVEDSLQVCPLEKKKSGDRITSYGFVITDTCTKSPYVKSALVTSANVNDTCDKSGPSSYNTRARNKRKVKLPAKFDKTLTKNVTKNVAKKQTKVMKGTKSKVGEPDMKTKTGRVTPKGTHRVRSAKSDNVSHQLAGESVVPVFIKEEVIEEPSPTINDTPHMSESMEVDMESNYINTRKVSLRLKAKSNLKTKTETRKTKKKLKKTIETYSLDDHSGFNEESEPQPDSYINDDGDDELGTSYGEVNEEKTSDIVNVKKTSDGSGKEKSSCSYSGAEKQQDVHEDQHKLTEKQSSEEYKVTDDPTSKRSKNKRKSPLIGNSKTVRVEAPKRYKVKVDEEGIRVFECPVCGYTSRYSQNVVKHSAEQHTDQKDFICDKCGAAFSSRPKLSNHMVVHSTERPFTCPLCPKTFKSTKTYHCDLCEHVTKYNTHIKTHVNRHIGHHPYQCETCGQTFPGKTNLNMHKVVHLDTRAFECQLCNKAFKDRGNYKQHMRRHVGYKQHVCEHCGTAFVTSSDLKKHIRTHTGEKPYKCDVCDTCFRDSSSLVRHKNSHTQRHRYECASCQKSFTRRELCRSHIKKQHGDSGPQEIAINRVVGSFVTKQSNVVRSIDTSSPSVHGYNRRTQFGVEEEETGQVKGEGKLMIENV